MTPLVGTSVERAGGRERVSGGLRYLADLRVPGMSHAALVTAPYAHARIAHLDTRAARTMPGVLEIVSATDLPQPVVRYGPIENDRPLLADGETTYDGEPVALVVAETEEQARDAARAVVLHCSELPGVYSLDAALAPGAPLVQDPARRPPGPFRHTNIYNEWVYTWGEATVDRAPLVLEETYTFPMVSHVAIEPHAFMAAPNGQGGVTVWSTVQHPFLVQRVLAAALNLPVAKVHVIAPDLGGGFGGKGYPKLEPVIALLALRIGRPVRLALSMSESFFMGRRSSCRVRIRTGFTPDGTIVFNHAQADYLIGAYADITARIIGKAAYLACGPYRMPHVHVTGRAVFSHTVPATAFRGFGAPQYLWALESQINTAARRLGLDAVDVRLRNLPARGETFVPGDIPCDGTWNESVRAAAAALDWHAPRAPGRGRGIAIGIKSPKPATVSQAIVRLHNDGSVSVCAGTTDMGQGSRTVLAQLAAHELQVPLDRVTVICSDTALAPFDSLTASSRSTVFMGNAVVDACAQIRTKIVGMAADVYQCSPSEISIGGGAAVVNGATRSYCEIIEGYYGPASGDVIAVGEYRQVRDPQHPLGGLASFWEFIVCAAEVAVDAETGAYTVTRLATVGDIGMALNPAQVEAQDEGGAALALGHTMMEHLLLDEHGRVRNPGVLDYRIPTTMDVPEHMLSQLTENADGPGPYGAKGTGESGALAVAPAVAAAIADATGLICTELPITSERLWHALQRPSQP